MDGTIAIRPSHSPLGASGAERWMNCPGSTGLLKGLQLPETDEPDYRREGTAAHEAAQDCLMNHMDAWEVVGQTYNNTVIGVEIADAIQAYIDTCRPLAERATAWGVEQSIDAPEFHRLFYGTTDFWALTDDGGTLEIRDYKNGAGIVVEVNDNPQLKYYAYGLLRQHPGVRYVRIGIVQPNAFHHDGPVRTWETTADALHEWAENVLRPAMLRTEMDNDLLAGAWCRFCPAKLVCPVLVGLFQAASLADPKRIVDLSEASLGRDYTLAQGVKMYLKALEEETFRRLSLGTPVPGTKLVKKKANRVYKPEAEAILKEKFGDKAMNPASLKSPAEMEKLGGEAKKLVHEYAFTPDSGLTVALDDDQRIAVKVEKASERFAQAAADWMP